MGPLGDAPGPLPTVAFGAEGHQSCQTGVMTLPLDQVTSELVLLILGFILGALTFSYVVGRRRARRLAKVADQLARAGLASRIEAVRYPDEVLRKSLEGLVGRIAEVEALATTDPQTRLLNRMAVLGLLAGEIDRANRYQRPLSVAMFDIDHFKRVNDTHGHAIGDDVLRHVAGVLRDNVRSVDTIGRYGGEEFLLVMPETDLDGGMASAEHLRRILGRTPVTVEAPNGELLFRVAISAGVTGHSGDRSLDVDQLLREADSALYGAKESGRDQVQRYRPHDEEAGLTHATIDPVAREKAARIGRAAFDASNLHLLGALAERPGWAGGASQLIADLSADLGRAIGLPDGDIDRIRTASLLHDLGKLAIPDEILSKPAALDAHEWRSIVEHPKIGQVVLEQAGAIRDAAQIVLHHHEWFDGRGYPHGLAGAEIPIGSRIVAIADAYEAMISARPYKGPMTHGQAIRELRRQAGIQFDPELVEVFVSLVGEGGPAAPADVPSLPPVRKPSSRSAASTAAGRRRPD
jgi:diguanylate cyclase (GGDEF)-like protein